MLGFIRAYYRSKKASAFFHIITRVNHSHVLILHSAQKAFAYLA